MNKLQENFMLKIGIPQQVIDDMNDDPKIVKDEEMQAFEDFLNELDQDDDFWGTEAEF